MHTTDGIDKIKEKVRKVWKLISDNKKATIAVIVVLIILFELVR